MDTEKKIEKRLSALGERRAIELITSMLTTGDDTIAVGPGDDCAAIDMGEFYLLMTTDTTSQKTHFPARITPYQMGWHIVAINLSDLAAKGGEPLGVVVATGLPREYDSVFLEGLIKGMDSCATRFGTTIIGGDLKEQESLVLTGTAIGKVPKNRFMPRSGANPGDIIAVTGSLGGAGAGYYALKNKVHLDDEALFKRLFEPEPRLAEGVALAGTGAVTSSMDISDGLADSLHQLAKVNAVGYTVELERIPIDPGARKIADELSMPIEELAVYFGGDYELLVTISPDVWGAAEDAVRGAGGELTRIGSVTQAQELTLSKDGKRTPLENRGYEHFKWEPPQ